MAQTSVGKFFEILNFLVEALINAVRTNMKSGL